MCCASKYYDIFCDIFRCHFYFFMVSRYVACREDQYQCRNTRYCISASRVCDGSNTCGDWSDENCSE